MKIGMILIVAITFLSSGFSDSGTWVIDAESQLTIRSTTNVSNFICKMEYYARSDTLQFVKNYSACELQFSRNLMTIPIRSFDCGGKQISKDFWKTLKYETYPQLDINFRSLQSLAIKTNSFVNGVVDISLAGITARYTIRYRVRIIESNIYYKEYTLLTFPISNLSLPKN